MLTQHDTEINEISKILNRALPINDNFKNNDNEYFKQIKGKNSAVTISIVRNNNININGNFLLLITLMSIMIMHFM